MRLFKEQWFAGAAIGIVGIGVIFFPEIETFDLSDKGMFGLVIGFFSVLLASFGNITSARNTKNHIPVLQANAFGMGYGTLLLVIIALCLGKEFTFTFTVSYIGSLLYLSFFGFHYCLWLLFDTHRFDWSGQSILCDYAGAASGIDSFFFF